MFFHGWFQCSVEIGKFHGFSIAERVMQCGDIVELCRCTKTVEGRCSRACVLAMGVPFVCSEKGHQWSL